MNVRSIRDRDRTADSTPLSTPSTIHKMADPMTSDSVIGKALAMTELTDSEW